MKLGDTAVPHRPIFTLGAWLLPLVGAAVVRAWMHQAEIHPHGFLPGLDELVYGSLILAAIGVACSIVAFLRRERWRWATTPIWLAGGTLIGWFAIVMLPR